MPANTRQWMKPVSQRFWEKVSKSEGCWVWTASRTEDGYGRFSVQVEGKHKTVRAHRWVWELTHGVIPEGMDVLHTCDNPPCVNPDHLFLGTCIDNNADKVSKGRQSMGEKHGKACRPRTGEEHPYHNAPDKYPHGETHQWAKLTEAQVREVLQIGRTRKQKDIAQQYGVSQQTISAILTGTKWKLIDAER